MKLYIQQRIFSIGDKYDVFDEHQNVRYIVEGKVFSIGAQLSIMDYTGKPLYFIKQRITFFLQHYELYKDDYLMADIKREITFFSPKLTVTSHYGDFFIQGDMLAMEFEIFKDSTRIGAVHKKWLSWGDTYELDIYDDFDVDFFVALVVAIDNAIHNENN